MLIWLCKMIFKLKGWKIDPNFPKEAHRSVMLAMPHTSNWDMIYSLAAFNLMGLRARFTIKKDHNRPPYGHMLAKAGALWIDRSPKAPGEKRRGMVEVMTELVNTNPGKFAMIITPEGTRAPNDTWRTGFYHVAMNTGLPISLGYLDYQNKQAGVGGCFMPSGDLETDMKRIIDFYKDIQGKFPEKYLVDKRFA